jgi:hypothetical protein
MGAATSSSASQDEADRGPGNSAGKPREVGVDVGMGPLQPQLLVQLPWDKEKFF